MWERERKKKKEHCWDAVIQTRSGPARKSSVPPLYHCLSAGLLVSSVPAAAPEKLSTLIFPM